MPYSVEIIRKMDQTTSDWSGGTTTQIAIYPKYAAYSERNFIWRLSSASVDSEKSIFTSLPEFWRLIMVLEGEMKLEHEGHHSVKLGPFEQDSFSGAWTTTSFGKVRDFNLMLAAGSVGQLTAIQTIPDTTISLDIVKADPDQFSKITSAFYCVLGDANITVGDNPACKISAGDVLLLTTQAAPEITSLILAAPATSHLVRADIKY
ncbi:MULTISPECIES: HutD family protein [Sporomusa]|uniref:HutD/Ves family protein n=1 Tax=Sporomusa TaxID=2375 RepID=UPI001669E2D2|nr:HutD family protein [Sporomusa sp. GT1]